MAPLCPRCRDINVNELLQTKHTRTYTDLEQVDDHCSRNDKNALAVNLGSYQKLEFVPGCPLCQLLLSLLPEEPKDPAGDVFLIPARTLHHVEPDVSMVEYEKNRKYANLLFITQKCDVNGNKRLQYCHEVLNAAGQLLNDTYPEAMPVQRINSLQVDTKLVNRWLSACEAEHGGTCQIKQFPELSRIYLIDVKSRELVRYPAFSKCQYLCLSYVWGTITQAIERSGSRLGKVPATIEDAMAFVRLIGKRYLWVDSVCISQTDETEKQSQITIMDLIYKGAWATIVALTGDSAYSGLPRVNPAIPTIAQTVCIIGNTKLATVGPTLKQKVNASKWSTRAWTYQEAILSPRCIYFTPNQVYFECNMVQCCESLDETNSPFHNIAHEERCRMARSCICHGVTPRAYGAGVFRDPLADIDDERLTLKLRNENYENLILTYTARELTYPSDILRACDEIFKQLQRQSYKSGFFWGLPIESLPYALLWSHSGNHSRRSGLPSWTWAGWQGKLDRGSSWDQKACSSGVYEPPLRVWRLENKALGLLWENYPCKEDSVRHYDRGLGYDPIYDAAFARPKATPTLNLDRYPEPELPKLLIIQGLVIQTLVTEVGQDIWSSMSELQKQSLASEHTLTVGFNGCLCLLECYNVQTMLKLKTGLAAKHSFLLVDRNWFESCVDWLYDLLLLEWVEQTCNVSMLSPNAVGVGRLARRAGRVRLWTTTGGYSDTIRQLFANMRTMSVVLE